MAGFQKSVTVNPAYAVEGDFASDNPRANVLNSPEDGLTAGAVGVTIGRFAWVNQADQTVRNNGTGAPDGFVARHMNALINALTEEASMLIPAGRTLALHSKGDFWAKTKTVATVGQKVFASTTTGEVSTGAAGASVGGHVETAFVVATAAGANELIKITTNK